MKHIERRKVKVNLHFPVEIFGNVKNFLYLCGKKLNRYE